MGNFFGLGGSKKVNEGLDASKNIYNKALGLVDPAVTKSNEQDIFGRDILNKGLDYTKTGFGTTQTGLNTLGQAKNYFSNIMSGTRPAVMAAIAPELNAVNEAADASRTSGATFGTQRGGGTAATNAGAETQRMTDINNALFTARPAAAKEVERIGGAQADIGTSQANIGLGVGKIGLGEQEISIRNLEAGLRALGLSEDAINNLTRNAISNRQASTQAWSSLFDSMLGGARTVKAMV